MMRAFLRVECSAKIAMTVLRSIAAAVRLLLQSKRGKPIFTDASRRAYLLIKYWAERGPSRAFDSRSFWYDNMR
jgi:hypothetical protein